MARPRSADRYQLIRRARKLVASNWATKPRAQVAWELDGHLRVDATIPPSKVNRTSYAETAKDGLRLSISLTGLSLWRS